MDRLAAFAELLAADPANSFARYGLAMEHLSRSNPDAALAEFAQTVEHNPDYVPAYQMAAQTLAKLNRTEEATVLLHKGLIAAERTGNAHAASEMQGLLDELA